MLESAKPEESLAFNPAAAADPSAVGAAKVHEGGVQAHPDVRTLEERELESTLQLLVERAQYITGATGTALALPQGTEMVCRASAGTSAPEVGASLQVQSGLTGESILRRQLLRCDNAETDPRVNLEACRALGIASIVVLPLLRPNGEVRGLFELFSDHPYAFEERDLIALERMAALTQTALDLAEKFISAKSAAAIEPPAYFANREPENHEVSVALTPQAAVTEVQTVPESSATAPENRASEQLATQEIPSSPDAGDSASPVPPALSSFVDATSTQTASTASEKSVAVEEIRPPAPALETLQSAGDETPKIAAPSLASELEKIEDRPVPVAMLRVQKCATCGFPVSEGRTLCLDCESKQAHEQNAQAKSAPSPSVGADLSSAVTTPAAIAPQTGFVLAQGSQAASASDGAVSETPVPTASEFIPAFLANSAPVKESWLSDHVNILAILVFIMCILVAIVVFK